jgi:hypothetical protein
VRRYWHDWTKEARPTAALPWFDLDHRTMAQVLADEEAQRAKWRKQYAAERSSLRKSDA